MKIKLKKLSITKIEWIFEGRIKYKKKKDVLFENLAETVFFKIILMC